MTDKQQSDGGPAFPVIGVDTVQSSFTVKTTGGMTLRDYFAGQALAGIAATSAHPNSPSIIGQAEMAYEMADAMLAVRAKSK